MGHINKLLVINIHVTKKRDNCCKPHTAHLQYLTGVLDVLLHKNE